MNTKANTRPVSAIQREMARRAGDLMLLADELESLGCNCTPVVRMHRSSCPDLLKEMCQAAAAMIRSEPAMKKCAVAERAGTYEVRRLGASRSS